MLYISFKAPVSTLSVIKKNFLLYFYYCSGFFDIYNEEKGNMEQHAVSILNVSVIFVYLVVFAVI